MDWCLYGEDKRREIDRDLKPEYLLDDLRRYQDVFGEEFGVKELLMHRSDRSNRRRKGRRESLHPRRRAGSTCPRSS